jgi:hypothetical protein
LKFEHAKKGRQYATSCLLAYPKCLSEVPLNEFEGWAFLYS